MALNHQKNQLHIEIIQHFDKTIKSIENPQEDTEKAFDELIKSFIQIGSYNKTLWHHRQSSLWWEKISILSRSERGSFFITKLKERIRSAPVNDIEPLTFLHLEMTVNQAIPKNLYSEVSKAALEQYPHNLEFLHTYAHTLKASGATKESITEAIGLYRSYIDAFSPDYPPRVLEETYNLELNLFRSYRKEEKFVEADHILTQTRNYNPYKDSDVFSNISLTISEQFAERKHFYEMVKDTEQELRNIVEKQKKEQDKNSFQQLAIFTAIITFIITAAGSSGPDHIDSAANLIGLGLILIMFVASTSLFFTKPLSYHKDIRVWVLVIFSILTAINTIETREIKIAGCLFNCETVIELPRSLVDPSFEVIIPYPINSNK
ncbi:hypothetical protein AB6D75_18735 [Vibrio splendidus]